MAKTLSASKPILKQDLQTLLEKAAYEAYLTQQNTGDCDPALASQLESDLKKAADTFAKKFAETAADPLATAIHNFVKEIGIMATPKGTLISAAPGAPVAGVINMTDFTIL